MAWSYEREIRVEYLSSWREILEDGLAYIEENFEGATIALPKEERGYYDKIAIKFFQDKAFQDFLDIKFENTYGSAYGLPFHIYTKDLIFASLEYDGLECVIVIPRNPNTFLNSEIRHLSEFLGRHYMLEMIN